MIWELVWHLMIWEIVWNLMIYVYKFQIEII